MPSRSGIRRSISDHVRGRVAGQLAPRRSPSVGLAHELDVGGLGRASARSPRRYAGWSSAISNRIIVSHPAGPRRAAAARRARPGRPRDRLVIVQLPPSSAARSRHRGPADAVARWRRSAPWPLSETVSSNAPSTRDRDPAPGARPECRGDVGHRLGRDPEGGHLDRSRQRRAAGPVPVTSKATDRRRATRRAGGSRRAARPRRSPAGAGRPPARRTSAIAAFDSSRVSGDAARCARPRRSSRDCAALSLSTIAASDGPDAVVQIAAQAACAPPRGRRRSAARDSRSSLVELLGPHQDRGVPGEVPSSQVAGPTAESSPPGGYLDRRGPRSCSPRWTIGHSGPSRRPRASRRRQRLDPDPVDLAGPSAHRRR